MEEFELLRGEHTQCHICRKELDEGSLRIDHCHETGRVRGILCDSCNWGIGYLGDNLQGVLRAAVYLRRNTSLA